jgi:hypothetical protein
MEQSFETTFRARRSDLSEAEIEQAARLVESKYATPAWIDRLP